jgi:hypothetical protein
MALAIAGVNAASIAISEVETNTRAVRTRVMPMDVGGLGSYSVAQTTGTMAAGLAANSPIFSFRWSSNIYTALIRRVFISITGTATTFTAGIGAVGCIFVRNFSASDSAGTAVAVAGKTNMRRSHFSSSSSADIRISSTATLTAGTGTLDANDMTRINFGVPAVAWTSFLSNADLWAPDFSTEWPLVLCQNEGFRVRVTVPATGTWTAVVGCEWAEIPFDF